MPPDAPKATCPSPTSPSLPSLRTSIFPPRLTLVTLRPYVTPRNVFFASLLLVIIVSGAILFMCLVGMITFSDKHVKDQWIEITSQILNSCFTLNALLLFPERTVDLWLLCRGVYGRHGPSARKLEDRHTPWCRVVVADSNAPPPLPRTTLVSIILLQNLNGWFQVPMAVSMWVWANDYTHRPAWLVASSLVASFLCGFAGGIWPAVISYKMKKRGVDVEMDVDEITVEKGAVVHADSGRTLVGDEEGAKLGAS
ncbi:uncharacterized protein SPPG_08690 [Spizellomyces punctatus DAOM BR117]|uniref:Uncharacterized protein n=1 Tax=Spizellomyces punctatus (strain DAOM BR117) TaxID=645134 RepID=A0A0L0H407_SPIPD|nr:uncharacterized protein SPPG_08690 [Spizellomyces punctatus DAOM BR117]KNC95937.1 hypothetical protein SPPG_08690 [Spizellomyces punctatus DAOM BR117]|eukprot:XP_016603977.1 hypothetical protein SPPG_08690 [Spizellomyces punctatus DAOM BR117]